MRSVSVFVDMKSVWVGVGRCGFCIVDVTAQMGVFVSSPGPQRLSSLKGSSDREAVGKKRSTTKGAEARTWTTT